MAIMAMALPWLSILDVAAAFRRATIQATGTASYLLCFDAIALAALPGLIPRLRASVFFWRVAAAAQLLLYFLWGALGLMYPGANVAGISLRDFSAGGDIGRNLTAGALMWLIWLLSLVGGLALLTPRGARLVLERVPVLLKAAVSWRPAPRPEVAQLDEAGFADRRTATLELTPPMETLGQGAASAFRRSAEPPVKPAPVLQPEPPAPVVEAPISLAAPGTDRGWQLPGPQLLAATPVAAPTATDNDATGTGDRGDSGELWRRCKRRPGQPGAHRDPVRRRARAGRSSTAPSRERDPDGRVQLDKDGKPKLRVGEVSRTRVRVNQITKLQNDLALALAAPSIRIEAPVPGKPVVGIEVPNTTVSRRQPAQRGRVAAVPASWPRSRSWRWRSGRASRARRWSPTWRRCRTC